MVPIRSRRIERSQFSSVPQALKDLDQWVVWKYEQRAGKPTKPPYNARTGRRASSTDNLTWCSFQEAEAAFRSGKYEGIGFVFASSDKFAGIDIDNCIDPVTGEINDYAQGIINEHPTYWDTSPSGTGVKGFLTVRSQLDSKRKKIDGIEIELYCSDRYFTVTGKHLPDTPKSVNDCTEAFKQLHQTLSQSQDTNKAAHSQGWLERETDPLDDEEILRRMFSEEKRGAEWKDLYESGTSTNPDKSRVDYDLIGRLAYYCGKDGHTQIERLAEKSALNRQKWDRKQNGSTWLKLEIEKACDRLEEPTSSLKTSLKYTSASTSFNSSTSNNKWPEPLGEDARYGLIGEFINAVEPHTEADPTAILVQTLIACGNIIGRSAFFTVEADRHYCNEFACIVGQSSRGRKGTSWGYTKTLLANSDAHWILNCLTDGLSTGEGLINVVRDTRPILNTEKSYDENLDNGILDKRLLVTEPEFARVLMAIKRENNTLSAVVRNAWDSGNLRTMTRNSPMKATGAHISLLTHVTQEELHMCLSDTQIFNGFANRFMWVCAKRSKSLPEGGNLNWKSLHSLQSELTKALTFAKKAGELHRDKEAQQLWCQQYETLTQEHIGMFGSATSRGEAHVLRLSMIYALLDQSTTIRSEHLKAALEVWRFCLDSAKCIFGGTSINSKSDSILKYLREHPEGISRTDLSSTIFSKNVKAVEIDTALEALLNKQTVRKDVKKGTGRPTELWFAV